MRILIVGDKEEERQVLRQAVTGLGHQWQEACDGDQGWLHYLEYQPDIVLSDFVMPGRSGVQLAADIRRQPHDHYTYVIILSSLHQRHNVLDGLRAGADDYLAKPVDVAELELRLLSATRFQALHQRLAEQRDLLKELNQKLYDEGRRDVLTGVHNRLRFQEDSSQLLQLYAAGEPVTMVLGDVDCFKQYNDNYGHSEGDKVLRLVAQHLDRSTPEEVSVYRVGGEEFLLVYPERTVDEVSPQLEGVRQGLVDFRVAHAFNEPHGCVTITLGVAPLQGSSLGELERALRRADEALYSGKEAGRNRVVCL
jgi:diguanylate cyclase (GGDEF)-like protein